MTRPTPDDEFAWKVHDGLSDWTARVDVKASIALAIEAAVVGFVITLSTDHRTLADITNWPVIILWTGIAALLVSVVLSILVVMPQLRARKMKSEFKQNKIYFGHLRRWDPADLAKSLVEDDKKETEQLARQLVNMSKIVWRKHLWLQWSLFALLGGVLLISTLFVLLITGVATK